MYTVQASWNIYPQDAFNQKELSSRDCPLVETVRKERNG